jgi:hypothetical protein
MKTNRTLIGAVALVSFFGLCGAKAQGCGGTVETEPAPAPCEAGFHLADVCVDDCTVVSSDSATPGAPSPCPQSCEQQCVPDDACPEGTVEQTVCDAPLSGSAGETGCASDGTGCYEPPQPPGNCWTECVPETCPTGTIPETVCAEPAYPSSACLDGDCAAPPPPAESCWIECVPVGPCGLGYHEETTCVVSGSGSGAGGGPGTESCTTTCVPDACPPDSFPIEVCTLLADGQTECWTECQMVEPPPVS